MEDFAEVDRKALCELIVGDIVDWEPARIHAHYSIE